MDFPLNHHRILPILFLLCRLFLNSCIKQTNLSSSIPRQRAKRWNNPNHRKESLESPLNISDTSVLSLVKPVYIFFKCIKVDYSCVFLQICTDISFFFFQSSGKLIAITLSVITWSIVPLVNSETLYSLYPWRNASPQLPLQYGHTVSPRWVISFWATIVWAWRHCTFLYGIRWYPHCCSWGTVSLQIVLVEAPLRFFRQIRIAFLWYRILHLISGQSVLVRNFPSSVSAAVWYLIRYLSTFCWSESHFYGFPRWNSAVSVNGPDNHHSVYLFCKDQRRNRVIWISDMRFPSSHCSIVRILRRMIQTDGIVIHSLYDGIYLVIFRLLFLLSCCVIIWLILISSSTHFLSFFFPEVRAEPCRNSSVSPDLSYNCFP